MQVRRQLRVQSSVEGTLVDHRGPLEVRHRLHRGKNMYDFVERGPEWRIHAESPLVYTYCLETGALTYGAARLWHRRELLATSASGQRFGAKPARPGDLDGVLDLALAHYARYRYRDPANIRY